MDINENIKIFKSKIDWYLSRKYHPKEIRISLNKQESNRHLIPTIKQITNYKRTFKNSKKYKKKRIVKNKTNAVITRYILVKSKQ